MFKVRFALSAASLYMLMILPVAYADSSSKVTNSAAAASSAGSSSSRTAHSKAPLMVAGVCLGTVFGTPICFVRRLVHDEKQGARGIVGESNNPALLVPAGLFWLPLATFSSIGEAPIYAIRNSWMAEKPLSKEQFSLGEMPEYDSSEILKPSE